MSGRCASNRSCASSRLPASAAARRRPACRGSSSRSSRRPRRAPSRSRGTARRCRVRIDDVAHRALAAPSAQLAEIFSSPGQSSCFSITQDGFSATIRRITAGRHQHREGERVVLEHERHVGADRLDRLPVVADDRVVGAQRVRRRDHHARGAASIASCVSARIAAKPGRRHADDDRHPARARSRGLTMRDRLVGVSLGASPSCPSTVRPATPAFEEEIGHAVDRRIESIRPSGWNGVGAMT